MYVRSELRVRVGLLWFGMAWLLPACGGPSIESDAGVTDANPVDGTTRLDGSGGECDQDGDGFDSVTCGGSDCDDGDDDRFPGNLETCDANDRDEDCDPTTFGTRDADGDGFHDAMCCNGEGAAHVCGTDCNDGNNAIRPNQADTCGDSIDQDCDEQVDEGGMLYLDLDNDGRGDPATGQVRTCSAGLVTNANDCDDDDITIYGGPVPAPESCDGVDSNCSGDVEDEDGDGHVTTDAACSGGFPKDDCNDLIATVHGAATEVCDGYDSDCSEGGGPIAGEDDDHDGHSTPGVTCIGPHDDCEDDNPLVHGGSAELCDELDNDCNPATNEVADMCGAGSYCLASGQCVAQPLAEVAVGISHTCIRLGEIVRCWGLNENGQLGDGTTTDRASPTSVPGLTGVTQITAGVSHTCARLNNGTVRCWGYNGHGQLGDGTTTDRASPTSVPGLTDVAQISANNLHTCARLNDGSVRCWGYNAYGPLGDGTTMSRLTPTTVPGLTNVVRIATGGNHTCAQLNDDTLRCWGYNNSGQLGDGTTMSRLTPTTVPGLTNVAQVTGSGAHTCVRLNDSTVRCWGYNEFGQVGDGTSMDRVSPTLVPGLSNVAQIESSSRHTCARLNDGTMRCWGYNNRAQLGDGTMVDRLIPTLVVAL